MFDSHIESIQLRGKRLISANDIQLKVSFKLFVLLLYVCVVVVPVCFVCVFWVFLVCDLEWLSQKWGRECATTEVGLAYQWRNAIMLNEHLAWCAKNKLFWHDLFSCFILTKCNL